MTRSPIELSWTAKNVQFCLAFSNTALNSSSSGISQLRAGKTKKFYPPFHIDILKTESMAVPILPVSKKFSRRKFLVTERFTKIFHFSRISILLCHMRTSELVLIPCMLCDGTFCRWRNGRDNMDGRKSYFILSTLVAKNKGQQQIPPYILCFGF